MFGHLRNLTPRSADLLGQLTPLATDAAFAEVERHALPSAYATFLVEVGVGLVMLPGELIYALQFLHETLDAELEYYFDRQIFEPSRLGTRAIGAVRIFATDSVGVAYGFDTGNKCQLVEIDEYRIVTVLDLTFMQFVEGMLVCYPQMPQRFVDGKWVDGCGTSYATPNNHMQRAGDA
jgi:hypothetical protein